LASESSADQETSPLTFQRTAVALVLGLLGSLFIWIVTPYNNFVLRTGHISDSYLPVAVVALLLLLVLIVNPVLKRVRQRWSLNFRQIALIVGVMLVAASISSIGLLDTLPYALPKVVTEVSDQNPIAEAYAKADLPASLFPGKLEYGSKADAARQFLTKLDEGQSIPWRTWLRPAVSWLGFFIFFWMMCVSLAGIVLPQWQHNEQLAFPLTQILRSIFQTPEEGRGLPPIFRERIFWIAAAVVFGIYTTMALDLYFPGRVPVFQTKWNLGQIFRQEPLSFLPHYVKSGRFYFTIIGVAYFMPTRVSFSICFFMVAYALYQMIVLAYMPPFAYQVPEAHRSGALFMIAAMVLWLGRTRWLHVLGCALRSSHSEADVRDRNYAVMFGLGIAGMAGWLVWAGVQVHWAVLMVAIVFIYQLVISRIVAETGLSLVGLDGGALGDCFRFIPMGLLNGPTAWFRGMLGTLLGVSSRMSVATLAMLSMSLDETAKPRTQWKSARLYVLILVLGFFLCGAVHIYNSYHHSESLDTKPQSPINAYGTWRLGGATWGLMEQADGQRPSWKRNHPGHMAVGAAMAGALQYASMTIPKWPLHPVGLLLAHTGYMATVGVSVLIGWVVRGVIVLLGGARLYRRLRPVFIGLIIGHILAGAFWFSTAAFLALLGRQYEIVPIF